MFENILEACCGGFSCWTCPEPSKTYLVLYASNWSARSLNAYSGKKFQWQNKSVCSLLVSLRMDIWLLDKDNTLVSCVYSFFFFCSGVFISFCTEVQTWVKNHFIIQAAYSDTVYTWAAAVRVVLYVNHKVELLSKKRCLSEAVW